MPKAIWSGAISFGLVNVPVKLTAAVQRQSVRFHQLHEPDGARIEQRRVCSAEDQEVPYEQVVKGYEVAPGEHVVVRPEELEALDPEASRTIDIHDFVDLDDVDPAYFQHAYYLLPDRQPAQKPYALLREAMVRSGKAAVARFVMRNKEYLGLIRPVDGALMLSTLLFHDELVGPASLEELPGDVELDDRELSMAEQLVDSLSSPWEPERYEDHHRARILDLIERKAAGEEVVAAPEAERRDSGVVDLVSALEASLDDAESDRRSASG